MAKPSEVFHEGERAMQRATGEQEAADQNAPMIADSVTGGASRYLREQRMLIAASRDAKEQPWASILFGQAGFVSADRDGTAITVDWSITFSGDGDVLWANLSVDGPVGLLAIELSTRRRLRINGRVELLNSERLVLRVEQAFPNCPKYIQRRRVEAMIPVETSDDVATKKRPVAEADLIAAVREADTAFVASGHPSRGLDASHRGGGPGFIQVLSSNVLRVPDYAGNSMFNTLGNLSVDPRCGLTILDFSRGQVFQMTGEADVHLEMPHIENDSPLTGRFWDFHIQHWRAMALPVRVDWEFLGYSPYNP